MRTCDPGLQWQTEIPRRDHLHVNGTNKYDYMGPYSLSTYDSLPTVSAPQWKEFWGWRCKPVGGRMPGDESELDDSDIPDEEHESVEEDQGESVITADAFPDMFYEELMHACWGAFHH